MQDTLKRSRSSILDAPLTALLNVNLEVLLWLGIILFSVVTRFWDLGSRSYNHDESLHTLYSWYLYQGRGYKHDPMMHGPFQFHINALIYFLFGDSDYTGRILPALFGVIAVMLPLFLRKYLGRAGALLAAVGIAIAPDILYYSRFARNDIYHSVWSLLAIIGLFGFITTRKGRYLILGAAAIALMWATKEVVFIFGFSGFTFLLVAFIVDLIRTKRTGLLGEWGSRAADFVRLPFRALQDNRDSFGVSLAREWATFRAFKSQYPVEPLDTQQVGVVDALRSIDLATVTIALSAALAIFVVLYTTFFTNLDGLRSGAVGAIEYWLAQQEVARGGQPWYYYLIIVPLYDFMPLLAAGVGVCFYALRRNTASLSFGVAGALLIVLTYAMWGRPPITANSPITVIGPFVLIALAFASLALAALQFFNRQTANAIIFLSGGIGFALATLIWYDLLVPPPVANSLLFVFILAWSVISLTLAALQGRGDNPVFIAFCIHWLLTSFIIYSWAGEKMPWLTLHMSLPAIVLGAKCLNDLWARIDWASVRQRGGLWLALLLPLIGFALLRVATTPWITASLSVQKIDARAQGVLSLFIAGALGYFAYRIARRLNREEIVQVAFAALLVGLAAFTVRAAFMGAYENGDVAVEMLIYAQGAPDVPDVMRDITTLSEKLTGGTDLDIVVESSETWPFAWYLRDYKKVAYPASLDGPPTAPVVIAGYENFDKYKPWMTNYVSVKRKLIWWFAEDYKGMTPERIVDLLKDSKMRESLLNFLFYRKFEVPLGQWPLRKEFTFYVRKDVANQIWTPAQLPPPEVEKTDKELQDKTVNASAKQVVGLRGNGDGQLLAPKGLAVSNDGSVYVADSGNHRIQKFDANGKQTLTFGTQGSNDGQFQEPWAVAVAPNGTIYVADTWNHRIQKFDATGKLLGQWGQFGDVGGQPSPDKPLLFYGPRAVALDAQGNVWVVDTGNKRVVKFDANGQPLGAYGGLGTAVGQFAEPIGIAFSQQTGDIYIADTWNHRVQRFSKEFQPLAQWNVVGWDSTSVVNKPYLALDANDNVYVTDPENQRVLKYANDGRLLAIFGKFGADASSFNLPTGIAIDAQGNIIVSDSNNHRWMKFDPIAK
ncbi:MAG: flippase activity-associated protein Agl23 [Chloroflexota bacterium]